MTIPAFHICRFDDAVGTRRIFLDGKVFYFTWSDMFGPLVESKTGREVAQPRNGHEFWKAITEWHRQGKRMCPKGFCIWHPTQAISSAQEDITRSTYGVHFYTGIKVFQDDRCCYPLQTGESR